MTFDSAVETVRGVPPTTPVGAVTAAAVDLVTTAVAMPETPVTGASTILAHATSEDWAATAGGIAVAIAATVALAPTTSDGKAAAASETPVGVVIDALVPINSHGQAANALDVVASAGRVATASKTALSGVPTPRLTMPSTVMLQ